jgi:hypothetical protein
MIRGSQVSWQEELRKLDEELAAGRLSADDYRVRRDQVLSSAVTQGDSSPAGGQQPKAESTQIIQPVNARPNVQAPSHESTQVVPNQSFDAERTQAAQSWQSQQPQPPYQQPGPASPPGGFPQSAPGSPAGGFQQPQQPWNAPEQDAAPPWGGSEFPPIVPVGSTEWTKQGPETFADNPKQGGKGKIVAIVVAVLLVGGIAFGAYWLWGTGDNTAGGGTETSEQQPPPATTPTTPQVQTAGPLVIPDGDTAGPKTFTADELADSKSLPEPDLVVIAENKVTKAQSVLATDGTTVVSVWAFDTKQPDKLREAFDEDQQRFGFDKASGGPSGIPVYYSQQENNGRDVYVFRAHYVSESQVIRVEAFDVDNAVAREKFDEMLAAQMAHLPPTS